MTDDPFELSRFVKAQNTVYAQVLDELGAGQKTSHWMWFVFPQVAGLGASAMSQRYAISGIDEAKAFLRHEVLGPRLEECAGVVVRHQTRSAVAIFGSPDDMKLHASMTLFDQAGGAVVFRSILDRFFNGENHEPTSMLLRQSSQT